MKSGAKKKYILLAAASLGVFVLLAIALAASESVRRAERDSAAQLSALYSAPTPAAAASAGVTGDAPQIDDSGDAWELPPRFSELYAINPEFIGWLRAGGVIDEPVVFRDNSFYLSHALDQTQSHSGTVFADVENSAWYSDDYVILYGHNIHGGDRFSRLSSYKDADFVRENPIIEWDTIRSGDAPRQYAVFAAFDASMLPDDDNYFHLRRFDELRAGGAEAMQALIDEVTARSCIDIPLAVAPGDDILALVTCSYSNADGRLMVFARALRADESAAAVARVISGG